MGNWLRKPAEADVADDDWVYGRLLWHHGLRNFWIWTTSAVGSTSCEELELFWLYQGGGTLRQKLHPLCLWDSNFGNYKLFPRSISFREVMATTASFIDNRFILWAFDMTPEADRRILAILMRLSGGPTGLGIFRPEVFPVLLGAERRNGFLDTGPVVHGMNAILRGWSFLMGNNRPECFPQKSPKFWDPLFFRSKFWDPLFH